MVPSSRGTGVNSSQAKCCIRSAFKAEGARREDVDRPQYQGQRVRGRRSGYQREAKGKGVSDEEALHYQLVVDHRLKTITEFEKILTSYKHEMDLIEKASLASTPK